jgi:hypothetical protein
MKTIELLPHRRELKTLEHSVDINLVYRKLSKLLGVRIPTVKRYCKILNISELTEENISKLIEHRKVMILKRGQKGSRTTRYKY